MLDTDYMSEPLFKKNFWSDWRKILGNNHTIQNLNDCDFKPIYEWHQAEKDKKMQMSTQEKKALREEKMKVEEKYMWAIVDGVKEKVGNFRVEPPGLFRGRGNHPKIPRRLHQKLWLSTLSVLCRVPAVVFLSGGQSEEQATLNLNAMNQYKGKKPWSLSFSFGRALQQSTLKAWSGKEENVKKAQDAFLARCKANSEATLGKYAGASGLSEGASESLHVKDYKY